MSEKSEVAGRGSDNAEVAAAQATEAAAKVAGDSVLEGLKRKREAISEARHLDLDIPGYDGELVARYKPVPWDTLKKIAVKAEASSSHRKELNAQADTIAIACDTIMLRLNGQGDPVPLHEFYPDIFGGTPAKYDERLGKAFGFEAKTARQAVLKLFSNDLAVTVHQTELGKWQESSRSEDDDTF